jgi:uncharacterized membrane protein YgcG
MPLHSRFAAAIGALCLLAVPAMAAPVAGSALFVPMTTRHPLSPLPAGCFDQVPDRGNGGSGGEGGFITGFNFGQGDGGSLIPVDCEGSGSTYDKSGPSRTDIVVASIEAGIEHCGQYTDVWRIDCISDELDRMARKMPRTAEYRQAKIEILAAAARLRALAEQNADPKQPAVRRAVKVGNARRTTTRPITAVAPSRVAATNAVADAAISELSTTLLRSAGNSATTARELTRVAQAVDSTKVLLRST